MSLIYSLARTNWGEFGGTEGTGDVVHAGRRQDLPISAFASSFPSFFICDILSSCSYSSSSLEKGDRRRRGGGGGEDGFTIDCGEKGNGTDSVEMDFSIMDFKQTLTLLCVWHNV